MKWGVGFYEEGEMDFGFIAEVGESAWMIDNVQMDQAKQIVDTHNRTIDELLKRAEGGPIKTGEPTDQLTTLRMWGLLSKVRDGEDKPWYPVTGTRHIYDSEVEALRIATEWNTTSKGYVYKPIALEVSMSFNTETGES